MAQEALRRGQAPQEEAITVRDLERLHPRGAPGPSTTTRTTTRRPVSHGFGFVTTGRKEDNLVSKTYTKSAQTGETAVAAVHGVVVDAGHVWHPRGVQDFGIDGAIELVDPSTRAALNKLLLVQVKGRSDFKGETDESFYLVCKADHIDYWLNGDVPVLLLAVKRETKEVWWKNVTSWFQDASARRTGRVEFDRSADRVVPATSGGEWLSLAAPSNAPALLTHRATEVLSTNVLPIIEHPERLYFAPTDIKTFQQSRARLDSHGRHRAGRDYLLLDGVVYSFRPLTKPPFDVLCSDDVEVDGASDWAMGDEDQRYRFKRLIKMQFGRDYGRDLRYDRNADLNYFRPADDLRDRVIKLPTKRKRTVVVDKGGYIRHHAVRIRFVDLDDGWFIALRPDYRFTSDGYQEHWNAGALKSGIKKRERHGAVRSTLLFWSDYFSNDQLSLLGDDSSSRSLRFGPLVTITVDVSYEEQSLPTDPVDDDEPLDSSARLGVV